MFENYEAPSAHVEEVGPGRVRLFVGDEIPELGEAVRIEGPGGASVIAEVRRLHGGRTADALLVRTPQWLAPGLKVARTGHLVAVAFPEAGDLTLGPDTFSTDDVPGTTALRAERPIFADLDASRPVLGTGFEGVDLLAPLAAHGINLVIDTTAGDAFATIAARVAARVADRVGTDVAIAVAPSDDAERFAFATHRVLHDGTPHEHLLALRLAIRRALAMRDAGHHVYFVAELPTLTTSAEPAPVPTAGTDATTAANATMTSMGEVVDLLGTMLLSTRHATVTSLVGLPVAREDQGLADIIETLSLGDVDSQLFVLSDGRFDPRRSTSRAELSAERVAERADALATLARARSLEEHAGLFGLDELDPDEQQILEQADALHTPLV